MKPTPESTNPTAYAHPEPKTGRRRAASGGFEQGEMESRAEQADRRLATTLRSLRERGEHAVDDLRSAGLPVRLVGAALVAGTAAVFLMSAVRSIARRRYARRRIVALGAGSIAGAAGRSFVKEMGARVLLGAAGVIGARFAGDVLMPVIAGQIAEGFDRAEEEERAHGRAEPEESIPVQAEARRTRARQSRRARVDE